MPAVANGPGLVRNSQQNYLAEDSVSAKPSRAPRVYPKGAEACRFCITRPCILKKKNPYNLLKLHGFNNLVPMVGLEPTRVLARQILNLLRLPIPPHRLFSLTPEKVSLEAQLFSGF